MSQPFIPGEVEVLGPFRDAGAFGPTEVHVAATLVTADSNAPESVLLGAALAVRAPLHGSVCVDIRRIRATLVGAETAGDPEDLDPIGALPWPDVEAWLADLAGSPLVRVVVPGDGHDLGAGDGRLRPLVLEGERLYLARYWSLEHYVSADVAMRAAFTPSSDPQVAAIAEVISDLFVAAADALQTTVDEGQLAAAKAVAERDLVVIAGGPGTGKTTTVARLLAGLAKARPREGEGDRIALVAPTGKAAARMTEALRQAISGLGDLLTPEVRGELGSLEAITIHRLLGSGRGSGFWHGPGNPLPHDLVIVDEASMVSLSLMAHLLAAISSDAKVVLVGDPNQLASVEAGAVLNDLVESTEHGTSAISASVQRLEIVHRQGEDSAILPLAEAIRRGRSGDVIDQLRVQDRDDVRWIEVPDDRPADGSRARRVAELTDEVVAVAVAAVEAAKRGDIDAALEAIGGTKVLAAMRRGRGGVDGWNRRVEDHLRRAGLIGRDPWHPGRPVMVTENDYVNEVFNGDVGVAIESNPGFKVHFPRAQGHHVVESVRLDRVATQWALSIHKSQGSEFPHAVVVLPHSSARILTRQLLYTGVTRAKERLTVVASEAAIRAAVDRPVARASGLADRFATG